MFKSLIFTITLATATFAAPITAIESTDFSGAAGPAFILGAGINTLSGSVSGCPNCGGDFQDNFSFVIPAGLIFSSGSFFATFNAGNGATPQPACITGQGCFSADFGGGFGSNLFTNGVYDVTVSSPYSTSSVIEFPGTSNYSFSITLTQDTSGGSNVPEPATWALLATGLAAIATKARRRPIA